MKHRGEIVRLAIERSGLNKSTVADRLGISRAGLYKWFDVMTLSWDRVFEIGKIINHDFSEDFPELQKPGAVIHEPIVSYSSPKSLEDCTNQLNMYREKYINAIEQNNNLLMELARLRSGEANSAPLGERRAG